MAISIRKGDVLAIFPLHSSLHVNTRSNRPLAVIEYLILYTVKGDLLHSLGYFEDVFNKEAYSEFPARHTSDLKIDLLPEKTPSWSKI